MGGNMKIGEETPSGMPTWYEQSFPVLITELFKHPHVCIKHCLFFFFSHVVQFSTSFKMYLKSIRTVQACSKFFCSLCSFLHYSCIGL